ncbi:MAG TPA: polyprenyl synthetase family protein [Acidimicrobiales bacterium]|nr:polyprenyl synthetase family protein [Acidimicrobiales bacterium]
MTAVSSTGLPDAVRSVAEAVNRRLADLLDGELARWSAVDADLAAPFEALRSYVLSGGKRLRPAFCFWAFVGAGGELADRAVVDAGAALEMLHTAALIHDDIIDGSLRRHGADTVHVRFADLHRRSGWAGRSSHFGEGSAIIIGDLALVYSSRLLAGAPGPAAAVFEEMRLEVNVGQYLDVLGAAEGVAGPADGAARARRICQYKTAKYTIERPLHLGAALADPDRLADLAGPLSSFGLPLGEAFQLKDDLLGVFGDPAVTGKAVADDLREGKPTLLASLAASRVSGAERDWFADRFGAADLTEADVARLQRIIEDTGARAEVEAAITGLVNRSEQALSVLPIAEAARRALAELARFVAGRDR